MYAHKSLLPLSFTLSPGPSPWNSVVHIQVESYQLN